MQHETAFKWQGHQKSVTDENISNAAAEKCPQSKSIQFHWVKIKFCKSGKHSDVAVFSSQFFGGMKYRESFGRVDGVNGSCEGLNLKKSAEAFSPNCPSQEVIRDDEGGLGQARVF